MLDILQFDLPAEVIDQVHSTGKYFGYPAVDIAPNSYAILRNEANLKHTAFVYNIGPGEWRKIQSSEKLKLQGLPPRDSRQCAFVNSLLDPKTLISVAIGQAGTGKTTLALAYALDRLASETKPIVLCKPTSTVGKGRAFGPVPGDVSEKYAPYLASYEICLRKILGKTHGKEYFKQMVQKGDISYVPIELVRGNEYANCTFILDEAQNLTWHELKSLVSRMGESTKMIILGDLMQIDTGMPPSSTGLYKLLYSEPFQKSRFASAIKLKAQYRSPITALVAEIDAWIANAREAR